MIKLRMPVEKWEWEELRLLHGVKVTDIKRDLGSGYLSYYYRLTKGQKVSYWAALSLAMYLSK
jgi:hypothetical protein